MPHEATDTTQLFALTLAGNAARVVIRDWFTSTAGEAKEQLHRWFSDLSIVGDRGRTPSLRTVLQALQARPGAKNEKGDLAAALATQLLGQPSTEGGCREAYCLSFCSDFESRTRSSTCTWGPQGPACCDVHSTGNIVRVPDGRS